MVDLSLIGLWGVTVEALMDVMCLYDLMILMDLNDLFDRVATALITKCCLMIRTNLPCVH